MKLVVAAATLVACTCCLSGKSGETDSSQKGTDASPASGVEWYDPEKALGKVLADLARAQGKDPDDYLAYQRKGTQGQFLEKGFVVTVVSDGKTYVIAVQIVEPWGIPGISAQQAVLLTIKGEILDRLRCDINSRYGTTRTEVFQKPEADGARLVIWFVGRKYPTGQNWWHNWHKIIHQGKVHTFREEHTLKPKPNVWDEKWLCRAKIVDSKFIIVFPDLSDEKGVTAK